jgi:hypothetical protein
VIEDFDGPDPAPAGRRRAVLLASALLLAGILAGYAAVSSPDLRGPYATPRPGVVKAPRSAPARDTILAPAAITAPFAVSR